MPSTSSIERILRRISYERSGSRVRGESPDAQIQRATADEKITMAMPGIAVEIAGRNVDSRKFVWIANMRLNGIVTMRNCATSVDGLKFLV